jgi:hypothetical protein
METCVPVPIETQDAEPDSSKQSLTTPLAAPEVVITVALFAALLILL